MTEAERRIREALADEALYDEGASVSDTLYAAHVFEEACSPENITALLADHAEREAALRAEVEALRADAERFASFAFPPFCDEYAGVDLYDQASIYASASGREEPTRDDYVAALRDAVDAALAQAKDAEAR